jgi:hypothetical protein
VIFCKTQLTLEEQERLYKACIDYSDIPPLGDEFLPKPSKRGRPPKNNLPFGWTPTFWNGSERMAGAIRPASTGFCGWQWKARPAKIGARDAAHQKRAAGRASEFKDTVEKLGRGQRLSLSKTGATDG